MAGVMISTTKFAQHALDQLLFMTNIFLPVWNLYSWLVIVIHTL